MSFPISPANGSSAVVNGINYTYSSATSSWTRVAAQVTATTSLLITDTVSAISTSTGALQVRGGMGVAGNLYVGGSLVAQSLTIQYTTVTTTLVQTDDIIQTSNSTNATSTTTGALQVAGGVGFGHDLFVGGKIFGNVQGINVSGTVGNSNSTDNILVNNTLSNTTYYLALADDLNGNYAGINADSTLIYDTTTSKISTKKLAVTDTTVSTSTATGALTVAGGVGIAGNMYVGGTVTATNVYVGPWAVNTGSGSVAVQYFGSSLGSINTINLTTGTTATISSNVITIQTVNTLLNIDGGFANSVYQSAEVVSGGGA